MANVGDDDRESGWVICQDLEDEDILHLYPFYPGLFTIRMHHGGKITSFPGREYIGGKIDSVDLVDIDRFSVHELYAMLDKLGYGVTELIYPYFVIPGKTLDNGLQHLSGEREIIILGEYVNEHRIIDVYSQHGLKDIKESMLNVFTSPSKPGPSLTIEEIDEPGPYALVPSNQVEAEIGDQEVAFNETEIGDQEVEVNETVNIGDQETQVSVDIGDQESQVSVEIGDEEDEINESERGDQEVEVNETVDEVYETQVNETVDDSGVEAMEDDSGVEGMEDDSDDSDFFEDTQNINNESMEDDSDFYVDETQNFNEDVDMRDFRVFVDQEVDEETTLQLNETGIEDEVIDNDDFHSGSESDENESSILKHRRHMLTRQHENKVIFYLGQVFGTKQEIRTKIKEHAVETRRKILIIKDEATRIRVVCKARLPDFEIDDHGVQSQSQPQGLNLDKGKNKGTEMRTTKLRVVRGNKGKGKVGEDNKGKSKVMGPQFTRRGKKGDIVNAGGRGHKADPHKFQCPWVILVSKLKGAESWMVKTLVTDHLCVNEHKVYACTSTFLAKKMIEQVEENPNIPVRAVQEQFRRKYELDIHPMKAYRARAKARVVVQGDYADQYSCLRDYCLELIDKNLGTTAKIEVEAATNLMEESRKFKRIYVCLGSLKRGFKAIGRDLLGLDGAFMKGPYPGQILSAVGMDPNNGIYPVAYAIVEAETLNSWTWFLELLAEDLDLTSNSNFTFITGQTKGYYTCNFKGVSIAEQRYCLRHIHENMKGSFRGKLYKDALWKCASTTTVQEFQTAMDELKALNNDAFLWLSKIPPQHWPRSHFTGRALSDVNLNNICEVFNSKILDARDKPILGVLEYLREYCLRRIVNVLKVIDRNEDQLLTPFAVCKLEKIKKDVVHYSVTWNGNEMYGVSEKPNHTRVVDLVKKTCACREWEITGIPCMHVVAALWCRSRNGQRVGSIESWFNPIYTMNRWKEVYAFKVNPINGRALWPKCQAPYKLLPPNHKKQVGRPRKARKRSTVELEELTKNGKLSRKHSKTVCGKCGNAGHNQRTCNGRPDPNP